MNHNQHKTERKQPERNYSALGISLGVCFGVTLGMVMHNLALGIGLGLCAGSVVSFIKK